jgi:ubiquinone/menaquinone biosynthesis C-methylase UbiE
MSDQKSQTKNFFDSVAVRYYERHYSRTDGQARYPSQLLRHQRILDIVDSLGGAPLHILDAGCGTGVLACDLLRRGHTVRGLDIAPNMAAATQERVEREVPEHASRCKAAAGDAENLEFPAGSFDVVIASGLLEYLETDEKFLNESARVLKPRGVAVVTLRNRLFNAFSLNGYTLGEVESGETARLLGELVEAFRSQPDSPAVDRMRAFASDLKPLSNLAEPVRDASKDAPDNWQLTMTRRQHTPDEARRMVEAAGLRIERTMFWHFHPFPPAVANRFPDLSIPLGLAMEAFGETPLGALMASGLIVSARKP